MPRTPTLENPFSEQKHRSADDPKFVGKILGPKAEAAMRRVLRSSAGKTEQDEAEGDLQFSDSEQRSLEQEEQKKAVRMFIRAARDIFEDLHDYKDQFRALSFIAEAELCAGKDPHGSLNAAEGIHDSRSGMAILIDDSDFMRVAEVYIALGEYRTAQMVMRRLGNRHNERLLKADLNFSRIQKEEEEPFEALQEMKTEVLADIENTGGLAKEFDHDDFLRKFAVMQAKLGYIKEAWETIGETGYNIENAYGYHIDNVYAMNAIVAIAAQGGNDVHKRIDAVRREITGANCSGYLKIKALGVLVNAEVKLGYDPQQTVKMAYELAKHINPYSGPEDNEYMYQFLAIVEANARDIPAARRSLENVSEGELRVYPYIAIAIAEAREGKYGDARKTIDSIASPVGEIEALTSVAKALASMKND